MAKFHFFTNFTSLTQSARSSYGPVQGNETSQYRVTSLFSSSQPLKAYAVCRGRVFAQEVNGKINLVLKPTEQPVDIAAPVKYFVYKGIKKDFLIDATDNTKIADASKSKLTNIIKTSQDARNDAYDRLKGNSSGTTTTPATIGAVGLEPSTLLKARVVDVKNPIAPEITAVINPPTPSGGYPYIIDVDLSWDVTCYNGKYYLYKMNASGNWNLLTTIITNNPAELIYSITGLLKANSATEQFYHRFKVKVENSSGLFNLAEKELTI